MKILLVDNYDSFTWNLVHLVEEVTGFRPDVEKNDHLTMKSAGKYDKIILSPGPGLPHEAGITVNLIKKFAASKSILGVCLGHQAIGVAFGGSLTNLKQVFHGVSPQVTVEKKDILFRGLPSTFPAGRYHSWVVEEKNLPPSLEVTARDEYGNIMALRHKEYDVRGVQFHPESILTPYGKRMMRNWIFAPAQASAQTLHPPLLSAIQ